MIGRYQVLRKIATGGMAELFLARQVGMGGFEKVVAIKRILSHLAHDEEFINMFRDEARIVAQLSHPNIVQIYDLGMADDSYFIAMEYISGRNMSSVAKRSRAKGRPMPPVYVARCLAQACEGLHYAHTRQDMNGRPLGIVHRDVSPQNIICAFSGAVKLVDFGIAKAASKVAHTRAGVLKGKYAYMSPEQIRGRGTDARSDLFAVGIVLYELLCGRRPFEKDNSIQTLRSIVREEPEDCQRVNPEIPDELAKVIRRCLEKDPEQRYASAQDVQLDLEDVVRAAGRINNLTISEWVCDLFAEELSQDQGQTVMFPGLGRVVLPAMAEPTPSEPPEPAESGAPLPPRGGGSMVSGRERLVSEEQLPPSADLSSSDEDDATVHMAALDRRASSVSELSDFDDSATEFAKKKAPRASSEVLHAVLDEHFAASESAGELDADDATIASPSGPGGVDEDDATIAMPAAPSRDSSDLQAEPEFEEPAKTRAYDPAVLEDRAELRHWFGAALDELDEEDDDASDDLWGDKTTADPPQGWASAAPASHDTPPVAATRPDSEEDATGGEAGSLPAISGSVGDDAAHGFGPSASPGSRSPASPSLPAEAASINEEPVLPLGAQRELPPDHEANTVNADPAALNTSQDLTDPPLGGHFSPPAGAMDEDYSALLGNDPRSGDLPGSARPGLSSVFTQPPPSGPREIKEVHSADLPLPDLPLPDRPRPPPALLKPTPEPPRRNGPTLLLGFALVAALTLVGALLWSQLRPSEVSLTVTTAPPGAALTLDGTTHTERTPLVISGLRVGSRYKIKLSLEGYRAYVEEIRPMQAETSLRIDLQPLLDAPPKAGADP